MTSICLSRVCIIDACISRDLFLYLKYMMRMRTNQMTWVNKSSLIISNFQFNLAAIKLDY